MEMVLLVCYVYIMLGDSALRQSANAVVHPGTWFVLPTAFDDDGRLDVASQQRLAGLMRWLVKFPGNSLLS